MTSASGCSSAKSLNKLASYEGHTEILDGCIHCPDPFKQSVFLSLSRDLIHTSSSTDIKNSL